MRRIAMLVFALFLSGGVSVLHAQDRQLTGRVTAGETGAGIAGVAVSVRGTTATTFTNDDGSFTFRVPNRTVTLVVAVIGYRTQELSVPVGQQTVQIELDVDALALDELVVTGAATAMSRQVLANAVSTVSDEELDRAPAATIEHSLQGKVAGAVIDGNSGAPGGGVQVRLRGVSTINGVSEPLYVVDGVSMSNAAIPSNQNAVTRAGAGSNASNNQDAVVNRIADLNPEEIQSIEILKGASAAAIYGSQAANGVVIITTKRGQVGRPRFNLTQRFGVFDLSNTLGFRQWETFDEVAAFFLDPSESTAADTAAMADLYGSGQAFQHEELLAGRNDLSYETNLSVSGGNEATRYYVSGLVKNDEGVIDNTGVSKEALRVNLDQRLGERFNLQVNTGLTHSVANRGLTNNDNSGTSFYMVFPFTPNFVDLRERADGTFPANPFERSNPLQTASLIVNDENVWRFTAAGNLTTNVVTRPQHELSFILGGGVDWFNQENDLFFPPSLQFEPLDGQPGTRLEGQANNLNANISANAVYTFRPEGASWSSTTSGGYSHLDQDLEIVRVEARSLTGGENQIDAGTNIQVFDNRQRTKVEGVFVQEELLLLEDRLLLTAAMRADRNSNNADPTDFFYYPKAAASFRFIEPSSWLDHLKLRAAYGESGNPPLFGQKFTPLDASTNIGGLPGLVVVGTTGADDLKIERQREIETGFDATMFGARASLEVTYYKKFVSDLLLSRSRAPSTGFTTEFFNGGKLETQGIEVALAATPVRGPINWTTRATFFKDASEVTELPVPSFRTGGFGTALGAFQIEEGASATQIVADISEGDSSFVATVGDANPDFKLGWVNDIDIGGFNVYFLWDWQQGGELINLTKLLYDFGGNTADYDTDPQFVERIGPVEIMDTLTLGERRVTGFGVETRPYIEDASYLKLREASLSYTLPEDLVQGMWGTGVDRIRLTLSGRNLLTFTDYTGLDPEVSNFGNQPIARNIDVAPFPPSRSFWLSVDVNF
ncbi:MAG TPA: SusC/RagA family TonB-linked outer membrane protein [Longimicrobiales bacterium]|nr:SusC/RagA family TonB-linked outer membrane protein [Longimicrobiales bacterium]